jgi:hypothetical protein
MSMHFSDYCDDTPHSKMNDLTKDELKFISDYIYLGVRDKKNHELLMRLDGKLQTLIDNSCEHDQGTTSDSFIITYCNKCGRYCQ